MSEKIKNLKSYFNNGDAPTEAQFHELIDSFILKSSDKLITTVKEETNGDIVFTFSDTTTLTIKKYKLPASMSVSFISGLQAALDAKATKNGDNTQLFKVKDAASANDAVSKQQFDTGLATKAAKNGDATQSFKVKDATAVDDAVSKQQFNAGLATKAAKNGDATQSFKVKDATAVDDAVSKQQFNAGLATKAAKNGDATQSFKVKDATAVDDAVSKQQFDTGLATKAAKNGDATQSFKVKDATAVDDAVSKQQFDTGLATKAAKNGDATQSFKVKDATAVDDAVSKQQFDTGLATKAAKNGDATQSFKVKDATAAEDAVNKQQLDTKAAKNGDASQIFKVKDAVAANDAISKQQFDAAFNRLIPAPFIDKIVTADNKVYQQPSSTVDVNIYGSYFTPTTTVVITGLTVTNFVFKSDNHIQVKVQSTTTTGSFDVIVNNGVSTTKAKEWIVSTGEVTVPQPSDFSVVSGYANISKPGEILLKEANVTGVVKYFNIPDTEEFQLEFKGKHSPFMSPIAPVSNTVHVFVNGVEKVRLTFASNATQTYTYMYSGTNFSQVSPILLQANLEGLGKLKIEKKAGKFKLLRNNVFHAETTEAYSGNVEIRMTVKTFDFVEIKKYKI